MCTVSKDTAPGCAADTEFVSIVPSSVAFLLVPQRRTGVLHRVLRAVGPSPAHHRRANHPRTSHPETSEDRADGAQDRGAEARDPQDRPARRSRRDESGGWGGGAPRGGGRR